MREQIELKWGDGEFVSSVSRVSASAALREMSVPEHAAEAGGRDIGEVLRRQAVVLLHLTELLSIDDYSGTGAAPPAPAPDGHALRLARLLECIAGLDGPLSSGSTLLHAALLYDLAGCQANAACLARRFDRRHGAGAPALSRIVSALLQRQFARLRRECLPLTREPDHESAEDLPHALGMAVAAKAVLSLGGYFLSGSQAMLDEARGGLETAARLLVELGFDHEFLLIHSVRSVSGPMAQGSMWSVLASEKKHGFAWARYAMLLARGPRPGPAAAGRDLPAPEAWPSPRPAVEGGLLDPGRSLIVRTPAGPGRARIAEMSILDALTAAGGGAAKCVYVAPHRALAGEVAASLSGVFADLGYAVSGMDGYCGGDDPFDDYAVEASDILVVTPEKLDMLARTRPGQLGTARLFLFDGVGDAVGDGMRGLKAELLLTRLAAQFPDSRLIVLSEAISDESIGEFSRWLCGREGSGGGGGRRCGAVTSECSPVLRRRARFEWQATAGAGAVLAFDDLEGDPLSGRTVEGAASSRTYEYVDESTGRAARERFPSPDRDDGAADLAFRHSEAGPVLVYGAEKGSAMPICRRLERRITLARLVGEGVPRHFLADPAAHQRSQTAASEWLGDDHEVTRLLARGIAVYDEGVPDAVKRAIEDDARAGAYRVMVASGALPRGAGMPARTVVVHSSRRRDGPAGRPAPMPAGEYWGLAGLAGRAGYETEGLVVHIVASAADRRDYERYGRERGRGSVRSHMHALLDDLAGGRMSGEDMEDMVDPDVLGSLAGASTPAGCEDAAGRLLSGTLAAVQMRAGGGSAGKMGIALDRFRGAARRAAGLGRRLSVYAGTGLGSHSCRAIGEYVQANRGEVERLVSSARSAEDAARLALLALGAVEGLPEMPAWPAYGGDRGALVRGWVAGEAVSAILGAAPPGGRAGAARLVGFLGGRAPQGVSAFVQIAAAELGIEGAGVPLVARCAPEMVRHGVPSPEAAWAVRLGAAARRSAMRIAADYAGERTVRAFARWLAGLDAGRLARYGCGPEEAAAIVSRAAGPNPLVRGGHSLGRVLGMGASVRCVENGSGPGAAARLSSGDPVQLERDHDGAYDRNAIAAYADGSLIGHVERDVAGYLAPLIDCGARIDARADGAAGGSGGPGSVRITLQAAAEPGAFPGGA